MQTGKFQSQNWNVKKSVPARASADARQERIRNQPSNRKVQVNTLALVQSSGPPCPLSRQGETKGNLPEFYLQSFAFSTILKKKSFVKSKKLILVIKTSDGKELLWITTSELPF